MNKMSPYLLKALIIFSLALVASLLLFSLSYAYMDSAHKEHVEARKGMQQWKTRLDRSVQSNQIIDEFESNFLKLVNRGVVGEEDRISWFETIRNTARQRGMPLVKYSISEQVKMDAGKLSSAYKGIDVFKSIMTLDIKMAHEGDLFALLNDLRSADGLYAVENCEIEKLKVTQKNIIDNMQAYCELGWYTFRGSKKKSSTGGKR